MTENAPNQQTIEAAHARIGPFIHRTPTLTSASIDAIAGASIFFKCENLQRIGAFKMRGAANAVLCLSEEHRAKGVATHSSGNHAQALAAAAKAVGCRAYIVMPENAPRVKLDATRGCGAEVTLCAATLQAREDTLAQIAEQTGAAVVHPYNDYRVIAGQATAAKELLEEVPELDVIIAPVGGGGLLSGTALIANYLAPPVKIVAAEPEGADDAYRSFTSGEMVPSVNPDTIADGLLASLGSKTFPIIKQYVQHIFTVSDAEIIAAMRLIWERMKIVVEPSAAVSLAAILKNREYFHGKRVGNIVSGGNVDLAELPFQDLENQC
ncbi:MAG: pyridoxal-phosphate dependent enzyme [Pseudomonadales bacterium]